MNIFNVIEVHGTLRVIYLHGKYGNFPVGTLETGVGTFTVRDSREDAWLETLSAGDYTGTFEITELSLYSYKAFGEVRTAIRAEVSAYELDGYADEVNTAPQLPDPIEEEGEVIPEGFSRDDAVEESNEEESSEHVELLASYVDGWNYGDDYRIDTTIGRFKIVACRKALLALGYVLDPTSQTWYLPEGGDHE